MGPEPLSLAVFCHERLRDLIGRRSLRDKARTVRAKKETSCTGVYVKRPASEQGRGKDEGVERSPVVHCEEPSCVSTQRELMSSSRRTKTGQDEERQQALAEDSDAAKTGSLQDGSHPCSNTRLVG